LHTTTARDTRSRHDALPIYNIGEAGTHAWNYVQMEDGKLYQVDTDWDDPQTKGGNSASYLIYDYFLQGNIVNSQRVKGSYSYPRSEEHTSELQSRFDLVCRP